MAEVQLVGEEGRGDFGPQYEKKQKLDVTKIAYMKRKVSFSAAHRLWRWVNRPLSCQCIGQQEPISNCRFLQYSIYLYLPNTEENQLAVMPPLLIHHERG